MLRVSPTRHSRESGNPAGGGERRAVGVHSGFGGNDRSRAASRGQHGFTLIELMVVIVIIGLAAAAVVLAVPDSAGSVQAEAERFAARAKAARDSAIVEARPVALTIDGAGYRFERRAGGAWRPAADHEWADGTAVEAGAGRTRFDSTGLAEPLSLTLRRGERAVAIDIGADGSVHVRR